MTDADLVYNACLRAERRLEAMIVDAPVGSPRAAELGAAFIALEALRQEIGAGLAAESR